MSDELIRRLVSDLRPVERLPGPLRSFVWFASSSILVVVVSAWRAGLRTDLSLKVHDPAYLVETAVLLVLFAAATLATLSSGVPGLRLRSATWLLVLAIGAWLALIGARYFAAPVATSWAGGIACLRRTLLLGMLPASILSALLRRAAPLDGGTSGALVATSAGTLAVVGTRLLCPKDGGDHVLLWHVLPLAALAVLGSLIGRACLERRVRDVG